jgi:hypothetical protein
LVALYELLATKIGKSKRRLYGTLGRWAWVPQHDRNKALQAFVNQWIIELPPKPRDVWDSWKK